MTTREMPVGGSVFWSAGQSCSRQKLHDELEKIGLADYTPCQRTEAASLKMALEEYSEDMIETRRARKVEGESMKRDKIVQSLLSQKEDGFEVVDVTRKQRGNDYVCDFSAKIIDGQVSISRGYANPTKLQAQYEVYRATLGGTAVGGCLVDIVKDLGGVSLKDSGGVYWLPPDKCERWEQIIKAFEAAGDNKVYIMRTVMDAQTVRAVADNITGEVMAASSELAEEIASGKLGEQAIENRLERAKGLHRRVAEYESILGQTMAQLHSVIGVAELAASSATAIREDDSVFDSIMAEA